MAVPDQELLDSLDHDLRYAITVEGKMALDDVDNYDEVGALGMQHCPACQ